MDKIIKNKRCLELVASRSLMGYLVFTNITVV